MKASRLGAFVAPLVIAPLAYQAPSPEPLPSQGTFLVHCEVWSAMDAELARTVEGLDPSNPEAVLETLRAAPAGAERLLRVLSPIDEGMSAQFDSLSEKPTVQITSSAAGMQEHFAGYTTSGTSATLRCDPGSAEGSVSTSLNMEISGFVENDPDTAAHIPPARRTVQVTGNATAAPGVLRMLQFETSEPGTLVVFVRASHP